MSISRSAWGFVASVVLYVVCWVVAAMTLPERVPLHFGGSGAVDRWGSRADALVMFAIIGIAMATLLGGIAFAKVPISMVNAPHKTWWTADETRVARLRALIREDGLRFGTATMLLLAAVIVLTVRAAELDPPHLEPWFFVVLAAYLVWTLGYCWHCWRTRYRPPGDGSSDTGDGG